MTLLSKYFHDETNKFRNQFFEFFRHEKWYLFKLHSKYYVIRKVIIHNIHDYFLFL